VVVEVFLNNKYFYCGSAVSLFFGGGMQGGDVSDKDFYNVNIRKMILWKGGFGCASVFTKISYWRLSRIANGWLKPSEDETSSIKSFLNASESEIDRVVNAFRYGR
jgi:hypothetical protein